MAVTKGKVAKKDRGPGKHSTKTASNRRTSRTKTARLSATAPAVARRERKKSAIQRHAGGHKAGRAAATVSKSSHPTRHRTPTASTMTAAPTAPHAPERRRQAPRRPKTVPTRTPTAGGVARQAVDAGLAAIRADLHDLRTMVQKLTLAPASTNTGDTDVTLEASVDSLRRLLSELIERRTEVLVRELVDVGREAAALPDVNPQRIVERLDQVLERLGAMRFEAEAMDIVDPLIHTVIEERHVDGVPEGVILETLRPGYRSARGAVVCRAAVVVSRR